MITPEKLAELQLLEGRRVRVLSELANEKDPAPLHIGDEGTVNFVDNNGTLHTKWDRTGVYLGLLTSDHYEILP